MHGRNVFLVESVRLRREHFEHSQGSPHLAKWSYQDRANTEVAAGGEIDAAIVLGVVAQENFAGPHTIGGQSAVGLETHADVRGGAAGTGAADDLSSLAQGNGGACGAGQGDRFLGDDVDARLKIEFSGVGSPAARSGRHRPARTQVMTSQKRVSGSESGFLFLLGWLSFISPNAETRTRIQNE